MAICYMESPVGRLALEAEGDALSCVRWAAPRERLGKRACRGQIPPILKQARRQLEHYFAGRLETFDLKLAARGTDFQKRVWKMMSEIPYGETATYGGMAIACWARAAARAAIRGARACRPSTSCSRSKA
jgi:methylated-DNA-[protein]-cysteine S-methyltransferase